MNDRDVDLIVLRACCAVVCVDEHGPLCPDLEAIANGDGHVDDKVRRFGSRLENNLAAARTEG